MIFLNLYTWVQISIKFGITNTLLHKFFQTDMIFFDQFKMPTINLTFCLHSTGTFDICMTKFDAEILFLINGKFPDVDDAFAPAR